MQPIEYFASFLVALPTTLAVVVISFGKQLDDYQRKYRAKFGKYDDHEGGPSSFLTWHEGYFFSYLFLIAPVALSTASQVSTTDSHLYIAIATGLAIGTVSGYALHGALSEWHEHQYLDESSRASVASRRVHSNLTTNLLVFTGLAYIVISTAIGWHWDSIRSVERCIEKNKQSHWVSQSDHEQVVRDCKFDPNIRY